MFYYEYSSPLGILYIVEEDGYLVGLSKHLDEGEDLKPGTSPLIRETTRQLDEFFRQERQVFQLKIRPRGTDFQKAVWKSLMDIPYGQTRSYKEVAASINKPQASRAVGNANSKNPLLIVIPCHRVINSNGNLGGYSSGLANKDFLLKLEAGLLG